MSCMLTETCPWIYLNNEHHWEPHSNFFQEAENNTLQCLENDTPRDRNLFALKRSFRCVIEDDLDQLSSAFLHPDIMSYNIYSTSTSKRQYQLSPELLLQRWGIGIETAKNTIKVTAQKGIRSILYPIERCFKTKQAQLRYKQLAGCHGRFYTDTFFSSQPALNGAKMAQLYINDIGFSKLYLCLPLFMALVYHMQSTQMTRKNYQKEI
jgi:hypothetical protein